MPRRFASVPARSVVVAAALIVAASAPRIPAADGDPHSEGQPWTIARRGIGEGCGRGRFWQVDYTLRNDGATARIVRPGEVSAIVAGTVSNSRVPVHARPKQTRVGGRSRARTGHSEASCDVIPSSDDCRRCREHASLQVWPADKGEPRARPHHRLRLP